jgi:hypothetical protein
VIEMLSEQKLPYPYSDYSKQHIRRLVRAGLLPRPVKIGRRNVWPRPVIEAHMATLQLLAPDEDRGSRPSFTSEQARAAVGIRWARYRASKAAEREAEAAT